MLPPRWARGPVGMLIVAAGMLAVLPVAEAGANADVRFVHAVPGGTAASLQVGGASLPPIGFGSATGYSDVPSGRTDLSLSAGGDTLADLSETLANGGRYTVVAAGIPRKSELIVVRDGRPQGGRARIRAINAAAELGEVDVDLGGRTVASGLAFKDASSYAAVDPGAYALEAIRPGGEGGALMTQPGATVPAGSATTAVLIGSGGERTRFLVRPPVDPESTLQPFGDRPRQHRAFEIRDR